MQTFDYANSLIVDMKSLSNNLKPISKNLYEVHFQLGRVIIAFLMNFYCQMTSKYSV